jgi:RND family efflux transporter MFP subunit
MKSINHLISEWKKADRLLRVGVLMVAVPLGIVVMVFVAKKVSFALEARQRLKDINAGPRVQVALVEPSSPEQTLSILGEARPYQEVTLYAKVSGFLRDVQSDKGDHVTEGQLLARIESPETSQQYESALADARNKQAIADRYQPLLDRKLVSQQEADQAFADARVAQANLESMGAIKGYQEIRAPFSGMVTSRFADPGTLVQNAANSQTSSQPIFTVSQVDRLRVYAYVDQKYAAYIHNRLPVHITVPERPDIQFDARITRFSGELDEKTRMLLAEVDIDNSEGRIVPGSYVEVGIKVKTSSYLEVPVEALILKDAKDFIPVVTSSNTIVYRPVSLADNDGQRVKVLSGLTQGETVALNLGNSMEEGSRVQPIPIAPPAVLPGTSPVK